MNAPAPAPAPTRLGQLQRGRGAGFLAAVAAGPAAHDDLLQCVLGDARRDRELESRARYYGELLVAIGLPLEPLLRPLHEVLDAVLAHDVLAAAWVLGHAPTRDLLAAASTAEPVVVGITGCLWGERWARPVDLPPRAHAAWLRLDLQHADSAQCARRPAAPTPLASRSVDEVLELARGPHPVRRDRLLGELCARGDEATRARLAEVVTSDRVLERARLAARALGLLADERLLPLAEDLFAREDVFAAPERRLPAELRMRRACLADWAQHLPGPVALPLARTWHDRGGYFTQVAGALFELYATAADRRRLEAFVAAHATGDASIGDQLDALGRLGDPASVPLLVEVATTTPSSRARIGAVRALTSVAAHPLAQTVLHEALWDCEDEATELACAFATAISPGAHQRITTLATHALVDAELAARALQRTSRR